MSAPRKLRVVLDTNVLISALGFQGAVKKAWSLAEEDKFDLFLSPFILQELEKNLVKKADFTIEEARLLIDDVAQVANIIEPHSKVSAISSKESDNRILECALDAKADVLVTGDLRDIRPLNTFRGIEILTPREFLDKHFARE
jgi:uncharacterized protein